MLVRAVKGSDLTLPSPEFVNAAGEPAQCSTTPTCTVARADGTALTAATVSDAPGVGAYTAALTAATHLTRVDRLTVTWVGTVTGAGQQTIVDHVDVIAGHYVQLSELRHLVSAPLDVIRTARDEVEAYVEDVTGRCWTGRYQRDLLDGDGTDRLLLSRWPIRSLIAVTIDGTAQTVGDFAATNAGGIRRTGGVFPRPASAAHNVAVDYEHGNGAVEPHVRKAVVDATRKWAAVAVAGSDADVLWQQMGNTGQIVRYGTASFNDGRFFGMQVVDAILGAANHRTPGIA